MTKTGKPRHKDWVIDGTPILPGQIVVKNKHTYDGPGELVDRTTPLGNPFKISDKCTREECIEQYKGWLENVVFRTLYFAPDPRQCMFYDLVRKYKENGNRLILICWCVPKSCHAQVIADRIQEYVQNEKTND